MAFFFIVKPFQMGLGSIRCKEIQKGFFGNYTNKNVILLSICFKLMPVCLQNKGFCLIRFVLNFTDTRGAVKRCS